MAPGSALIASSGGGGGGGGGGGIAPLRFQNDGRLDAVGKRLFGDHEPALGIGDDHRRSKEALAGDPVKHLLEGR
jgi:hypothetical protein